MSSDYGVIHRVFMNLQVSYGIIEHISSPIFTSLIIISYDVKNLSII